MTGDKLTEKCQDQQNLYLVFGGELEKLNSNRFKYPESLDIAGIFPNYETALLNWRAKAYQTVDNAHMRYYIVKLDDFFKNMPKA